MKTLVSFLIIAVISVSAFAQKSVLLKYNLEPGTVYRAKSTVVQDQTINRMGTEQNTETKISSWFSLKALNMQDDHFMAEVRFDTLAMSMSMPVMEIHSKNEGDITSSNPADVMQAIFNRYSKVSLVVKMSYTGHVQQIMNYNIIPEVVLAGTDSLQGQAAMAMGQISMMLSEKAVKSSIEGITAYLPNEEIKKKGSWTNTVISAAGGVGSEVISTYTLNSIDKGVASVSNSIIANPIDGEPMVMNGAEIRSEIEGLGKEEMEINTETGWIISSSKTMQMSGDIFVSAGGQNFQMPTESKITAEVEALD